MEIILYNSKAEPIRVHKETYLTNALKLTGSLRESCSVITPSILIQLTDNFNYVIVENPYAEVTDEKNSLIFTGEEISKKYLYTFNYVYIPEFKRYYYVNDIISVASGLWRIELNVDVLMSYKREFLDIECIINRQEFDYDRKLPDNNQPCLSDELEEYLFSEETPFTTNANKDAHSIVLSTSAGVTDVLPSVIVNSGEFDELSAFRFCNVIKNQYGVSLVRKLINSGQPFKELFVNLSEGVTNITLFPFDVKTHTSQEKLSEYLYLGDRGYAMEPLIIGQPTPIDAVYVPSETVITLSTEIFISPLYGNEFAYMNYNPYTKLDIFIPFFGWFSVNPDICIGRQIRLEYNIDLYSGNAIVKIIAISLDDYRELFVNSVECIVGMSLPIARGNFDQARLSRALEVVSAVSNVVTFSKVGGGVQTNTRINRSPKTGMVTSVNRTQSKVEGETKVGVNYKGIVNSLEDVLSTKASFNNNNVNTTINHRLGLYCGYRIRVPNLYYRGNDDIKRYNHLYGRPTLSVRKLSELNGFTKVGSIHLDNINGITIGEIETLERELLDGIIL